MKNKKKVKYFKNALAMMGIGMEESHMDLLARVSNLIARKGGKTSLKDIHKIQYLNRRRFTNSEFEERQTQEIHETERSST